MKKFIVAAAVLAAAGLCLALARPALAQKKSRRGQGQNMAQKNQKDTTKIDDRTFAKKAAMGGMAEVALGRLGEKNAKHAAVRDFARRIVIDHDEANRRLLAILQRKNMTVPTALDSKHREAADRLGRLTGSKFDRAFMKQMVKDHVKTVKLFKVEAKHGRDPDLKAFASQTLPTLSEHLARARRLAGTKKSTTRQ
jgi:putative membrane protein